MGPKLPYIATHMTDSHVNIFDRSAVQRNRRRAALGDWGHYDFLIRETADRLIDRIADVKRDFPLTLDVGARAGAVAEMLGGRQGVERVIQCDLSAEMAKKSQAHGPAVATDEEWLPFAEGVFDLALSNVSLHWVNDLPGALVQIKQALKPDGLFLATMFGGQTLQELRDCMMQAEIDITGGISPRVSPFADTNDIGGLLQRAGFALPVVDSEYITITYENMFKLLEDLRGMGEMNAVHERVKHFSTQKFFMRAAELYAERYTNDEGRIFATFQVFYLHGWAPHSSQQQPAARGSGTTNLANFLMDDDNKTGSNTES